MVFQTSQERADYDKHCNLIVRHVLSQGSHHSNFNCRIQVTPTSTNWRTGLTCPCRRTESSKPAVASHRCRLSLRKWTGMPEGDSDTGSGGYRRMGRKSKQKASLLVEWSCGKWKVDNLSDICRPCFCRRTIGRVFSMLT
jgi:hypothetical protein